SSALAWLRCNAGGAACVATGATGADYTPVLADAGSTLRAQLTPANGGTSGAAVRSEPTQVVLALNLGPVVKAPAVDNAPWMSGATAVGQTLTAMPGTWLQLAATFSYAWLRCDALGAGCAPIAGATATTYVPTAADRGHRLVLSVTGALLGLIPSTAASAAGGVVA
ncbi:MAG: hypothetical protein JWQ18_782, partial [Conexibacter sp.]|nr:hypothetical protein [Conexibacter sp.]